MAFDLTDEQRVFATMLRGFFTEEYTSDLLREVVDSQRPYDQALWKSMVDDLGLSGLSVPEEHGGAGGSAVDLAVLWEQYGRSLVGSPLFSTVGLALPVLLNAGTSQAKSKLVPRIESGAATATWAVLGSNGEPDLHGAEAHAERTASGWALSGRRSWVLDGTTADFILTIARTEDGAGLFAVEPSDSSGIDRIPREGLDPTLPLGDLLFDAAPARLLSEGDSTAHFARALAEATINLAALQLGCLSAVLDMAVDYAKNRVQFGRPIGGFQAIKHRCADIFVDAETTRWVVFHAAANASDPSTSSVEITEESRMSTAYATASALRGASHLLQILGGIGYTWEHTGHLYFKRATAGARLLGSTGSRLDEIAASIDTFAPSDSPILQPEPMNQVVDENGGVRA